MEYEANNVHSNISGAVLLIDHTTLKSFVNINNLFSTTKRASKDELTDIVNKIYLLNEINIIERKSKKRF